MKTAREIAIQVVEDELRGGNLTFLDLKVMTSFEGYDYWRKKKGVGPRTISYLKNWLECSNCELGFLLGYPCAEHFPERIL